LNENKGEEDRFLARMKTAVEKGIGPQDIEDFMGQAATVNTQRSNDRAVLSMADIGADTRYQQDLPDLWRAKDVAYWPFHETPREASILGMVWSVDGGCELFHGVVYPP